MKVFSLGHIEFGINPAGKVRVAMFSIIWNTRSTLCRMSKDKMLAHLVIKERIVCILVQSISKRKCIAVLNTVIMNWFVTFGVLNADTNRTLLDDVLYPPLKKHPELRTWASGFPNSSLSLQLRLANLIPWVPEEDTTSVLDTLVFCRKYTHRCGPLSVTVDPYTLSAAIQELHACDLTQLNSSTCERYPGIHRLGPKSHKPVESAFNGDGPITTLYILRLFDMVFDWLSMGRFSTLAILVLHNSKLDFAPTECQLEGLLRCKTDWTRGTNTARRELEPRSAVSMPSIRGRPGTREAYWRGRGE
ncbi:hypothetical protein B0H17DRAFT_1273626 [Mycena rosella]|uniref:Uncharacterized protein n=1 Tax=Mycena rosella TaxID=1033263 RepID=A0AAD7CEZ2_MYCRO|nr:hypothetical protein B0H17DRAFT_1273626 [Mycena rosella]